jgi:hypothetical protein
MTNRQFKLNEKQRNLERDARRLLKQFVSAAMLDDYTTNMAILIRARTVGKYDHRSQRNV